MTTKLRRAQAYSVFERAAECGAKSRDVRCHSQTAERTGGTAAAYKLRQALPWPPPRLPVLFKVQGRHGSDRVRVHRLPGF